MRQITKRTAAFAAATAAVALVAVGCGEDDKASDVVESAKSSAGQLTESLKPSASEESGAEGSSTTAEGSAAESTEASGTEGAGGETTIAGPDGQEYTVAGPILAKYTASGGPTSPLGAPTSAEEAAPGGGKYQEFVGGIIYWNDKTQAHVVWGKIREAWETEGGPEGSLGYPISDEKDIPGGKQSDFENGHITFVNNETTVVPK